MWSNRQAARQRCSRKTAWMLPREVESTVERYLDGADRLLPDRVVGLYVVGSVALAAYRDGRSDVDVVAVVDGDLGRNELRRLRVLHVSSGMQTAVGALRRGRSPLTGTCNAVYVRAGDLSRPVTEIAPLASHAGISFAVGEAGSDVSPVAWKVLAEHGITMRGPEPGEWSLDPEPERLRSWCLENLHTYWRPWALRLQGSPSVRLGTQPRWTSTWGVLGVLRVRHTIEHGEVVSKEAAAEHALESLPARWHPLLHDALAYRRVGADPALRVSREARGHLTASFVLDVVDEATSTGGTAA